MSDSNRIPVVAPGKRMYVTLGALFAFPVVAAALSVAWLGERGMRAEQVAWVAAFTLLVVGLLLLASRRRSAELENGALRVRASLYTLTVSLDAVDWETAGVVDLDECREARPRWRTNGFGVPGFSAGHFRDAQRRRLFCLITAPRVLVLPISDGRRVLLSASSPERALDRLRERAQRDRRDSSGQA